MGVLEKLVVVAVLGSGTWASVGVAADPIIAGVPSQGATLDALPLTSGPASIPSGTSVTLRLKEAVTSRAAKRGDYFKLELVNDIRSGPNIVIPAGTTGVGQVVHSAPKGFGGRAGELIIAARYLETKDRRIALRKTKFSVAGSDNVGAALATSLVSPIIGLFVTGTSVDLSAGSIIVAEIAEDLN